MTPLASQVYEAAMALPEEERAELASRLLDSLPRDTPSQLHSAWGDELRRRLAQVDSGEVTPLSWEEVKRRAWETVEGDGAAGHG
jgi:putative addiction module component (TIGR02574 family)